MMEGNLFTVCVQQCTTEFQPSADQSWQSWANNELNTFMIGKCPQRGVLSNRGEVA